MKKRMKKLVALVIATCMITSITACGSKEEATETVSSNVEAESISVTASSVVEEIAEAEVPEEETVNQEEADVEKLTEDIITLMQAQYIVVDANPFNTDTSGMLISEYDEKHMEYLNKMLSFRLLYLNQKKHDDPVFVEAKEAFDKLEGELYSNEKDMYVMASTSNPIGGISQLPKESRGTDTYAAAMDAVFEMHEKGELVKKLIEAEALRDKNEIVKTEEKLSFSSVEEMDAKTLARLFDNFPQGRFSGKALEYIDDMDNPTPDVLGIRYTLETSDPVLLDDETAKGIFDMDLNSRAYKVVFDGMSSYECDTDWGPAGSEIKDGVIYVKITKMACTEFPGYYVLKITDLAKG